MTESRTAVESPLGPINDPRRCDFLSCYAPAAIRFHFRAGSAAVYCPEHAEIMRGRRAYDSVIREAPCGE